MPAALSIGDAPKLLQQLGHLDFKPAQIQNTITFLSQPSALTFNLLGSLSPLEASIEYLILHVPECDLPERFLPSDNSSNPFITSTHSGADDLKKRWIEDKAIKEAGWPTHVVKQYTSDQRLLESWELLIAALGKKLIGEDVETLFAAQSGSTSHKIIIGGEEVEALGAQYVDQSQVVMPLFSGPVNLHILISPNDIHRYPSMYITSKSVPAYIRLHLLSRLLLAIQSNVFMEPGEGFLMAAMRILEDQWANIEDQGPPDVSEVMQHMIPRSSASIGLDIEFRVTAPDAPSTVKSRRMGTAKCDDRSDQQVKDDFEALCRSDEYTKIFATRKALPAFAAKHDFLIELDRSRVVVVVGETGNVIHSVSELSCPDRIPNRLWKNNAMLVMNFSQIPFILIYFPTVPQFILDSLILSGQGAQASIIVSATETAVRHLGCSPSSRRTT